MGSKEHVYDTIRSMHVNEAAHITVGKTHNRVQNERKYPCTAECQEQRFMYLNVRGFAWDSSNFSVEGSKSTAKWAQTNMYRTPRCMYIYIFVRVCKHSGSKYIGKSSKQSSN